MATQAERRQRTRHAILEAAARVLVARGEQGFSTSAVAAGSGFSNGALFRHFPTRKDLVVATVEHVLAQIRHGYQAQVTALAPEPDQVDPALYMEAVFDLIWTAASDERLLAVFELYAQARTDAELRQGLEPIVARHSQESAAITDQLTVGLPHPAAALAREHIALALATMGGIAVNNLVGASLGAQTRAATLLANAYTRATRADDDRGPESGTGLNRAEDRE